MAPRFDLQTAFDGARVKLEKAGRDASIAMPRYDPQRIVRTVGTRTAKALIEAAKRAPPALRGQLLVAAAQVAPKREGALAPKPARRPTMVSPRSAASQKSPGVRQALVEAGMQADAFVCGAADVLTFTKADEIAAGLSAAGATALGKMTPDTGDDQPFSQRYRAELAAQQRRDAFDRTHRSISTGLTVRS